jgi:hypothetical protein
MNGYWTVEVTGRNDWSSTLPKENASYFYPSVSSSLILSDLIPAIGNSQLTYLKLRGSWARVGSDADPYQLATLYVGDTRKFAGNALYTLSGQSANSALRPEQTTGTEGGIEFALFDDRLTVDASYYQKISRDQILPLTIAPATGFTTTIINAGQISNKGIEASITARPIKMANSFTWSTTLNYNKNTSRVDALQEGLSLVNIPGPPGNVQWGAQVQARVGEPYGQIFAQGFKRDSATGQLLLAGGFPQRGAFKVLGNINPNWVGGWANELRYKSVAMNVLVDVRNGGHAYSVGNQWGTYAGVLENSLEGRELDWDKPGLTVQGIDEATGKPNTTVVTAEDYRHSIYPIVEPYIYGTGFVKLREARLSWEVPSRLAAKAKVSQLNIALVGRNLATWTDYPNYDPENASNTSNQAQGFEMGALPTTKSIGINLSITP